MQVKANDRAGMIPGIIVGASVAAIALSSRWLPAQVACFFGFSGEPNGFVGQGVYLSALLILTVGTPLLVRLSLVALVRGKPGAMPIPNRDYWLAPERRDETLAFLVRQTAWIASAFAVFVFLVHLSGIRANGASPPHQRPEELLTLLAGILGVCVFWAGCIAWRFGKP